MIYAIDFGTSNSLLGAAENGKVFPPIPLDPFASDPTVLRSLLYFPTSQKAFYGAHALKEFNERTGEGRLIRSIKKFLPMRSFIGTYVENRPMNLEDIISYFLREMRTRANEHFQKDVDSVVLGRPAKFSDEEDTDLYAQFRLEQAAQKAGFKHIEFFPEPVAAACEFRMKLSEPKNVLVADFGGGTSDFSVIRMDSRAYQPSDVLAIGGVSIAGDVLDGSVMKHALSPFFGADVAFSIPFSSNVLKMPAHLIGKICSPADVSLLQKRDVMDFLTNVEKWAKTQTDKEKMGHLFTLIQNQLGFPIFESIEKAKRVLSKDDKTTIDFDYPTLEIHEPLTREDFENHIQNPARQILDSLDETIKRAGLAFSDIDVVCCTGGTAKVALLNRELVNRFGADKIQQHNHFHSVVEGLAQRALQLQ